MKCSIFIFILSLFHILGFSQSNKERILDSVKHSFLKQVQLYPQEKLYVQIDKPYYIVGEDIWFRAHLVDAFSMLPDTTSRYIYGELIDPLDSVQVRVKVRPKSGAYFGYIGLDEELPSGDYQLRFYTRFMEGRGDNFFFKRTVHIGDPLSALYQINMEHTYLDNHKKVKVKLSFNEIDGGKKILPQEVRVKNDKGELQVMTCNNEGDVEFTQKRIENKNVIYVEFDYLDKFHKEYISIPNPEDYEVSFLPEGGHIVLKENNKVAFKALNSDGIGEKIQGVIINEAGDTLTTFSSQHLGMGAFYIYQKTKGDKLYALCRNEKGIEKRFELPSATEGIVALRANWQRNNLYISLSKSADTPIQEPLFLVIQSRGISISVSEWDKSREFVSLSKEQLPTGISQLLLVDSRMNPISERLVFNINENSFADIDFRTDKSNYGSREKVNVKFAINNVEQINELANVSLSVTDDKDVKTDSCVNILSTILITSDLKGYIEDPAYYFRNKGSEVLNNLDLLMMTQGWSRYNTSKILKQEFEKPSTYLELGPEISGTIEGGILMNRKSANYPVRLLALKQKFFDETVTDELGRFRFNGFEFPDSTQFVVQGNTKKGGDRVWLTIDQETFPKSVFSYPPQYNKKNLLFRDYLNKADQKFILDNGMRMIYLKDIEITALKKNSGVGKSVYSSSFNTRYTLEQIEQFRARDLYQLLSRFAGVTVVGQNVSIRGNSSPLVMIDNTSYDINMLGNISIEDVDEVEIVKDAGTVLFGSRGASGVILITTKRGIKNRPAEQFNIKSVSPLGYQSTKEFYSPQYETTNQKNNKNPDLRSTIYWNPSVKVSDIGNVNLNFYTADSNTSYSVIIEGITTQGRLIHSLYKIKREDSHIEH